ncbi:hypothetical protein B0H13DRAFT_2309838 [Mycena leptocephala]|nr:hypothetical protein B0H13DRAFT_2309838 [Mycena leptocephala]
MAHPGNRTLCNTQEPTKHSSEAHAAVLHAELEDFELVLEEGLELEEGEEDGGEEGKNDHDNDRGGAGAGAEARVAERARQAAAATARTKREHDQPESAAATPTPGVRPAIPVEHEPSASSTSGGWDGAGAGAMVPLAAMGLPASMGMGIGIGGMKVYERYDGKGFYHGGAGMGAGAEYELGPGFNGEESLLLRSSGRGMQGGWGGASPVHPAIYQHQQQQRRHAQQQVIWLREVYEWAWAWAYRLASTASRRDNTCTNLRALREALARSSAYPFSSRLVSSVPLCRLCVLPPVETGRSFFLAYRPVRIDPPRLYTTPSTVCHARAPPCHPACPAVGAIPPISDMPPSLGPLCPASCFLVCSFLYSRLPTLYSATLYFLSPRPSASWTG